MKIFKKNVFNYKSIILSLVIPVTFVSSCKEDYLDTFPQTSLSDATAFQTADRVLGQINGIYDGLKSGQFLGGRYQVYNDIRAEEFIVNKPNGVTGLDTWRHNLQSTTNEVNNLWNAVYSTINRSNVFLSGIDANTAVVGATLADQYKAEAKFVRALCYYSLLQLYAKPFASGNGANPGVPLRLKAETGADGNDLVRSTVAEVYAQVLKDLNEAEAGLPSTYSSASLNISRASKNTAIALKTRVYLSMGNYTKVIEEGNKIVSASAPYQAPTGVNHKLEPSIATVFGGAYTGTEAIFSMIMTDLDAPGTQNQLAYYYNLAAAAAGGGFEEYYLNTAPAGIFSNPVFATASTDARKAFTGVNGTKTFLTKFKRPAPYTDYVPVIRYSEVLLSLAEANARTGNTVRALALLSAVRNRSNASYVFPAADIATPAALIATILTERRIELLGEGFRSPDLLRLLATIPAKSDATNIAQAVDPTSAAYIWPIPSGEINVNKLITQN